MEHFIVLHRQAILTGFLMFLALFNLVIVLSIAGSDRFYLCILSSLTCSFSSSNPILLRLLAVLLPLRSSSLFSR